MILKYFSEIFSVFYRWWWAALTGVFSLLGALYVFEEPVSISPWLAAIYIFIICSMSFLAISLLVVSWKWYISVGAKPCVNRVIPEQLGADSNPLTFVIDPGPVPLLPSSYLALFYSTEHGNEVCAAVLEVRSVRNDGKGVQAEAKWISPPHRSRLQSGDVAVNKLHLRVLDGAAVAFIIKAIMEEV